MTEGGVKVKTNRDLNVKLRIRKPKNSYQICGKTSVDLLSAFDLWEEAKVKWVKIVKSSYSIKSVNARDASLNPSRLAFELFSGPKNVQSLLRSSQLDEYFIRHLLSIHECFCTECLKSSDKKGDTVNDENGESDAAEDSGICREGNDKTEMAEKLPETAKDSASRVTISVSKRLKVTKTPKKANLTKISRLSKTRSKPSGKKILIEKEDRNATVNEAVEDLKTLNDQEDVSESSGSEPLNSPVVSNELTDSATDNSDSDFELSSSEGFADKKSDEENSKKKKNLSKKNYSCKTCGKEYKVASTLKIHMFTHSGTVVECPDCGKTFKSAFSMNLHKTRIHNEAKKDGDVHSCETCGKEFADRVKLKSHKRVHIDQKDFICDICGKGFKRKYYLKDHRTTHTGENSYKCDICGAAYKHKTLVYRHKMEKHGNRDQLCKVCGKSYFTSAQLKRHELTHSEEPHYKCRECGKGYRSESGLESHANTHKETLPNVCHFCGKSFVSRSNMYKHLARHQGIKPHKCNCCEKGFVTKQELTAHSKVHEERTDTRARRSKPKTSQEKVKQALALPLVVASEACNYGYNSHSNYSGASSHSIAVASANSFPTISTNEAHRQNLPVLNYGQTIYPGCEDYRYY